MKFIINLLLIIVVVILQISLIKEFSIYFGIINLILIVMLILVFVNRPIEALWWAGVGGMALDLVSGAKFGLFTLSLLVIYYIVNLLIRKIFTDPNIIVVATIFLLSSILVDAAWLLVNPSWQILLMNAIYNTIVGSIFYFLFRERLQPRDMIRI